MDRVNSSSEPLNGRAEPGIAAQFLRSAAYAGAEAPLRAVAQFAGAGADNFVKSEFDEIGVRPPDHADFNTKAWYAQQLGYAFGMAVPFLALRAGVSRLGEMGSAAGAIESAAPTVTQLALKEGAISGATGLAYGALFSPSNEAHLGTWRFLSDRVSTGLTDMAVFGTLGIAGSYTSAGLGAAAAGIERTTMPDAVKTSLASTLRFPLFSGMVAGVPAGVVNAEAHAFGDHRFLATPEEFKENIVGMTFVGGTLGTMPWLVERGQGLWTKYRQAGVDGAQPEPGAAASRSQSGTERVSSLDGGESRAPLADGESAQARTTAQPVDEAALREKVEQALRRIQLNRTVASLQESHPQARLLDQLSWATANRRPLVSRENIDDVLAGAGNKQITPTDSPVPGMEVVLGASGIEAPAHAGFLQALEDRHVPVGRITGVSGGSLVATLYANGRSAAQIKDILLSDQFRYPKLSVMAECLHLSDPWNLFPYSIDFRPWVRDFIKTYDLKPQKNLRIVAADSETHEPVIFEGENMDLETAITGSAAATNGMNMKPVPYKGRELIDGFYYHPTPAALSRPPALVSKIGFVSQFPSEFLSPWDYLMHLRELSYHDDFVNRYPDPPGHIIAETGLSDVATTTFGVSKDTLQKLVQHGNEATDSRLSQPDAVAAIKAAQDSLKQ